MDIKCKYTKQLRNFLKLDNIFLLFLIIAGLTQIIMLFKNNELKKLEKNELNNHSDKIENCIDIENKNKRTIYENIKLSEYCINKFGTIRWKQHLIIFKINFIKSYIKNISLNFHQVENF